MTKYYKCDCCSHICEEGDIERVNDTSGASDGTVEVCPECRAGESMTRIPDLDWKFEKREEARLDAMFEARYAED